MHATKCVRVDAIRVLCLTPAWTAAVIRVCDVTTPCARVHLVADHGTRTQRPGRTPSLHMQLITRNEVRSLKHTDFVCFLRCELEV